jgi:hypothetical protein
MQTEELLLRVRRLVDAYPGDRYLYLHRSIVVAKCLQWDFSDTYIRAELEFERLVIGTDWTFTRWDFGVRWDDIDPHSLDHSMLSGCQLRDTIVLAPKLLQAASSVNPTSDARAIADFRSQVNHALWG